MAEIRISIPSEKLGLPYLVCKKQGSEPESQRNIFALEV